MRFRAVPVVLAVTGALLAPAAASADVPWAAPSALPGAAVAQAVPAAMTAAGHAGAVTANAAGAATPSELLRLGATGTILANDPLGIADAHVVASGADTLVVAGSSLGTSGTIDDTSHLRVATAPAAGGAFSIAPVSGSTGLHVFGLAANTRGDVAVLGGDTRERVVYLQTASQRRLHAVLTIAVDPSTARDATVALGAKGDVLVLWEDHHTVKARHRGTRSWGAVATLGAGVQSDLSAVVDDSGRLSAAWKSQRVGEGESNTPAIVSFITAAPGRGWGTRRRIESVGTASGAGHYVASPGIELDAVDAHHTLLTWTGINATNYAVKAMTIADGHTAAAQVLSPAGVDAVLGDTTVGAGATAPALVLWRAGVRGADPVDAQTTPRLFASTRASGAAPFGAPEAISDPAADVVQPPTALVASGPRTALALFAITPGGQQLAARAALGG
jgi:hypothetical protein